MMAPRRAIRPRPALGASLLLALLVASCNCVFDSARGQQQQQQQERENSWDNPVQTAADDEIKNLPGLNDAINFRQYSGYLEAHAGGPGSRTSVKYMHYWFVESQNDPAKDPIVLWLNGGPGCSSLGGLFTELGPFQVADDGKSLKLNKFSWNKVANVIFLESPTQVGFSYSKSLVELHTDDSTANENHLALKSFFKKFPQYKSNELYLTGESYAGVYLPTLGVRADADPELNLKGIAIGNGYLDVGRLSDSVVFFAYYHGLVGKTTWDRISAHCCAGQPPTREACTFSGPRSTIGCRIAIQEVTSVLVSSHLNPYNLYGDCAGDGGGLLGAAGANVSLSRDMVGRQLLRAALDPETHSDERPFHVLRTGNKDPEAANLTQSPPCVDDHILAQYLNQADVRNALHIPTRVQRWDICNSLVYIMKYPTQKDGLMGHMRALIGSSRKLKLLVYNGDVDMVCNFLGDEWFVDDLGRKLIADYQTWKVGKQVGGYVKHYDGITFATIRGSGHMVPGDRPKEALEMFKIFLGSKEHLRDFGVPARN